jgi:hypothetical protein
MISCSRLSWWFVIYLNEITRFPNSEIGIISIKVVAQSYSKILTSEANLEIWREKWWHILSGINSRGVDIPNVEVKRAAPDSYQ